MQIWAWQLQDKICNIQIAQHLLGYFYNYCNTWKLNVNVDKTKVVVFRNGARLQNINFYYNNNAIDIVDNFCYLGLTFNYNGIFTLTQKILASQGKKAQAALHRKTQEMQVNTKTLMYLFDTYISPVIN